MNNHSANVTTEIASIEQKSNMQCSIHAWLRDKNRRYAAFLDYGLMAAATYLLGISLLEPAIGLRLSVGVDTIVVIPVLSLVIFFLSVVQFKSGWKSAAEAHHRTFSEFAAVKSECRTLTSGIRNISCTDHQEIRARYDMAIKVGTPIPDNVFLSGKAYHSRKVFVSCYLDTHQGARPFVVKIKLFVRDNFNFDLLD